MSTARTWPDDCSSAWVGCQGFDLHMQLHTSTLYQQSLTTTQLHTNGYPVRQSSIVAWTSLRKSMPATSGLFLYLLVMFTRLSTQTLAGYPGTYLSDRRAMHTTVIHNHVACYDATCMSNVEDFTNEVMTHCSGVYHRAQRRFTVHVVRLRTWMRSRKRRHGSNWAIWRPPMCHREKCAPPANGVTRQRGRNLAAVGRTTTRNGLFIRAMCGPQHAALWLRCARN